MNTINLFITNWVVLLLFTTPFLLRKINVANQSLNLLIIISALSFSNLHQKAVPVIVITICILFCFENIRKSFDYIVYNVTADNYQDINDIACKYITKESKIEIIKYPNSAVIRGPKKYLKGHQKFKEEVNLYVKKHGKTSIKNILLIMLVITLLAHLKTLR